MIPTEALRVFVCIVEEGSFNMAAVKLHKSQPAVSKTIQNLESRLEFVLFDRSQYRPLLTPKGHDFYRRAKNLIKHCQQLEAFADTLKNDIETDISIAVDIFFPLMDLKDLFRHWVTQYPITHFHFLSESLGGACERLVNHQTDIIISENLITHQAVEVIPLQSLTMIPVATQHFIHQHYQQLQHVESLNQCMQVIIRDSSKSDYSFGVVEHARRWTVSDVLSKKQIILAGLGWGRLPANMIQQELATGKLQILEGNHFDSRVLQLAAIRLQKPAHGIIAEDLWLQLKQLAL